MRVIQRSIMAFLFVVVSTTGCYTKTTRSSVKHSQELMSKTKEQPSTIVEPEKPSGAENASEESENTIIRMQSAKEIDARLIKPIVLRYPKIAKLQKIQGEVVVRMYFDEKGDLDQYKILTGQPIFIDAVKEAILSIKLRPYLENGQPAKTFTVYKFTFSIEQL